MIKIKMIVAVDNGNAIGWSDGRLPWQLPEDMKRFKELTTGDTVVMGSKTFKSLGRSTGLPNRKNVVLTKHPEGYDPSIKTVSSLDYVELERGLGTQWIIGGASVYAEALERKMVDELYVTLVHTNSGADVTLPFDLRAWKLYLIRERNRGVIWDLIEMTPSFDTTFLTFRKQVI